MKNKEAVNESPKRKVKGVHSIPDILYVSPSPHMRKLDTVRSIMLDVIIALIPAIIWAVFAFGNSAMNILIVSVITAIVSEAVCCLVAKKKLATVTDLSAVVTGIIVGLMLPAGVALWIPAAGSAFAIIVAKQFFGGLGMNIVNPAIASRVFLMICWPDQLVKYSNDAGKLISGATPLAIMKEGKTPGADDFHLFHLVLGDRLGAIGEVSAFALAAALIYLLVRKVITWHIPVTFIGTVVLISVVAPQTNETSAVFYSLLSGSLLFSAVFCANDTTTTPITGNGKIIFGLGCGLITVFIRYFGAYPEGTAYAILVMNLLVPLIDVWTKPTVFGGKNEKKQ